MAHYVRVSSFASWIRGYLTPMTDRKSSKKGNNNKRAKVLYRDLRDDFPDTKDAYDTFVDRYPHLINAAYVHHHNPKYNLRST